MVSKRDPEASKEAGKPQASQNGAPVDPASQSPERPIEFARGDEVARGNAERANAEPEPPALHDAQVPGKTKTDAGHR